MRSTDRTVHVEDQNLQRSWLVDLVDPFVGKVHQLPLVVLGAEDVFLEPANFASGSGALIRQRSPAANRVANRWLDCES